MKKLENKKNEHFQRCFRVSDLNGAFLTPIKGEGARIPRALHPWTTAKNMKNMTKPESLRNAHRSPIPVPRLVPHPAGKSNKGESILTKPNQTRPISTKPE